VILLEMSDVLVFEGDGVPSAVAVLSRDGHKATGGRFRAFEACATIAARWAFKDKINGPAAAT